MSRFSVVTDPDEAVAGIADGATVLVGGFGMAGMPVVLIDALIRQGATDLTVVSNNAGQRGHRAGRAARRRAGAQDDLLVPAPVRLLGLRRLYRAGKVDLEVVPQGNLAERMRAAGAGIGAFFCPTGVGTPLAEGKETADHRRPATTCSSTRSAATSPWSRPTSPTPWATWSTARPPATSGRSWPRPRR